MLRAAIVASGLICAPLSGKEVFLTPAGQTGEFERFNLTASDAENLARIEARIGDLTATTRAFGPQTVAVRRSQAGVLVFGVATQPREIEISRDGMVRLASVGFTTYDQPTYGADTNARARLTHFAKAITCLAPCPSYDSTRTPLGHGLEFVAVIWERDQGADLTKFILLADGVPLDGHYVTVRLGNGQVLQEITDGAGEVWLPSHFNRPLTLSAVLLRAPAGDERL